MLFQTSGASNALRALLEVETGRGPEFHYQHVLAWSEALEKAGIELSVWRSTGGSG